MAEKLAAVKEACYKDAFAGEGEAHAEGVRGLQAEGRARYQVMNEEDRRLEGAGADHQA